jgi:hypothetical protein
MMINLKSVSFRWNKKKTTALKRFSLFHQTFTKSLLSSVQPKLCLVGWVRNLEGIKEDLVLLAAQITKENAGRRNKV